MADVSFWQQVLAGLGAPVTAPNIAFLQAWANAEGMSSSANNPLATTWQEPGSYNYNSVGVQVYPDVATGVDATIKTISQSNYYPNLKPAFMSGDASQSIDKLKGDLTTWAGATNDWYNIKNTINGNAWQQMLQALAKYGTGGNGNPPPTPGPVPQPGSTGGPPSSNSDPCSKPFMGSYNAQGPLGTSFSVPYPDFGALFGCVLRDVERAGWILLGLIISILGVYVLIQKEKQS